MDKKLDEAVASDLNNLSLNERNEVFEELHGVKENVKETPALLSERLVAMEIELRKIPDKPAYDLAEKGSREFVNSPKFRLMFLRAEAFDAKNAASRMVNFFQLKLDWFGVGALTRPVYLSDLDKDDLAFLKSGYVQVLPVRDSRGRAVIVDLQKGHLRSYKRTENLLRAFIFMLMELAEDEETQRHGVLFISYYVGQRTFNFDSNLTGSQVVTLINGAPIRMVGIHFCHSHPFVRAVVASLLIIFPPHLRSRIRFHYGPNTECQYILMTYGIPSHYLPVTYDLEPKNNHHNKWVARRRTKEEKHKRGETYEGEDLPRTRDILVGRGKPFRHHPGNLLLTVLMEDTIGEYLSAPLGGKSRIVGEIVQKVEADGARFLTRSSDGSWVRASSKEAEDKIRHTFRTMSSTMKCDVKGEKHSDGEDSDRRKRARKDMLQANMICCLPAMIEQKNPEFGLTSPFG